MFRRRSTAAAPAVDSIEDKPLEPRKALKFIPVRNETNIVLALMGLAGGLFVLIAAVLILVLNNYALANRSKVYVQLKDGTTDSAQEFDGLHRDPEIIKNGCHLDAAYLRVGHSDSRLRRTRCRDQN
jgi:hypothetical protein